MARRAGVGLLAVALAAAGAAPARAAGEGSRAERTRAARGGAGHLGVALEDVSSDDVKRLGLPAEEGARVRQVTGGSPAAQAGVETGDVIVAFAGETVHSAAHLSRLVRETPAGRGVALTVMRAGARRDLHATLDASRAVGLGAMAGMGLEGLDHMKILGLDGLEAIAPPEPPEPPQAPEALAPPDLPEPPEPPAPPRAPALRGFEMFGARPRLGIQIVDLTPQLARHFKVEDGVLVSSVNEGSPAEKAGLQAGDVIVKVDGEAVRRSGDLARRVSRSDEREVTLGVQRDGRPLEMKVRLEPRRRPAPPTT